MAVVIVQHNAGNTRSVSFVLERLGVEHEISDEAQKLKRADKVIFPGVGHAGPAIRYLRERELDVVIRNLTQPVLGICVGMQLMCGWMEEADTEGMGIFDEQVLRFPPDGKVPHMGWNDIKGLKGPLFDHVEEASYLYFVHSYYVQKGAHTTAVCDHIRSFSAAMQKDNFHAVQFHPERSGDVGELVLKGFLECG